MIKLKDILPGIPQGAVLLKDSQLLIFFMCVCNAQWLSAFNASPLSVVVNMLIATPLLVLAVTQLYALYKEKNRSLELWLNTIGLLIAAIASNIAIYSMTLTAWAGLSFAAGPWIFFGTMMLGVVQQISLFVVHAVKAYQAPENSVLRRHHQQAMFEHARMLALAGTSLIAVVFAMFTPAAPVVATVFAALTVSLLVASIVWSLLPHERKLQVKAFFGFEKPCQEDEQPEDTVKLVPLSPRPEATPEPGTGHGLSIWSTSPTPETAKGKDDSTLSSRLNQP